MAKACTRSMCPWNISGYIRLCNVDALILYAWWWSTEILEITVILVSYRKAMQEWLDLHDRWIHTYEIRLSSDLKPLFSSCVHTDLLIATLSAMSFRPQLPSSRIAPIRSRCNTLFKFCTNLYVIILASAMAVNVLAFFAVFPEVPVFSSKLVLWCHMFMYYRLELQIEWLSSMVFICILEDNGRHDDWLMKRDL